MTREILQLPSLSPTDYLPVVELLLFMSLGVMVARGLSLLHTRWSVSGRWLEGIHAHTFLPSLSQTLFIASVAVHFGNYFMSGVEKVLLDGGPMVWVTSNETPWLMEVAARGGFLPISSYTEFSEWVHGSMKSVYPLSNTLVLVSQLIAVVAILRTQWALWLTIFYDLTHVFIFVVSGIFFWKWILLNAIIVYGLARLRGIRLGVPLQVLCIGLVIAGNLTFFTARLGWYDTRGFVHHYFEAVTADGRVARVPSNFFLSGSVTVAQNRLGTSSPNHFPLGTWGNTKDNLIRQRAAQDCNFDDLLANRYVLDEKFLRNFVRRHSKFVIDRVDREGHFSFDWYPHHIFSSAAAHRSFYEIDLRDIVEYRYIVESVCLDGTLQSERDRVVHRDVINIEVP